MQIITRDGISVRIPPDVTSAGGAATEAYVAALPAEYFPPIPADLRAPGQGPAVEAYLDELRRLGALAPFQAKADAHYAFDLKAFQDKVAATRTQAGLATTAPPVDPEILRQARAAAQRTAAQLGSLPAPAPAAVDDEPATVEE